MQYINKVNVKLLNYALSICYQLIVLHCSNVECVHLFCSFQLNTDFRNDYTLYRWTLVASCQLNSNGLVTRLRHFLLLFRTGQIVLFSSRKNNARCGNLVTNFEINVNVYIGFIMLFHVEAVRPHAKYVIFQRNAIIMII